MELDAAPRDRVAPIDAGRRTVPVDARPAPRDAPPVIADARSEPAGQGKLTVKHRPDGTYLIVFVDGKRFGITPVLGKALPAGTHTVELFRPDTDERVHEAQITIDDGEAETVQQP